jgi:hypothetical protein
MFFKININRRSKDAATHDDVEKYGMSTPVQQTEIKSPSVQCKHRTHVYKQQANYRSMEHQKEKFKVKGNNIFIVL